MSILNSTFYPSPPALVRALIAPYDFDGAYVLDPSAGDGRILTAIRDRDTRYGYGTRTNVRVYACELEPDLRAVLREKGIPLVGQDFLLYAEPTVRYTHIIMNPPFNHGEGMRHLIHAWNILRSGELACALPLSALDANTSYKLTLQNLLQDYGYKGNVGAVQQVGQVYRGSERPTAEELVIVRLTKPDPDGEFSFDAERDPNLRAKKFEDQPDFEIALPGFVPNLLAYFAAARNEFEEYARHRMKMERYVKVFGKESLEAVDTGDTLTKRYNNAITAMQEQGWAQILDHPAFRGIMTERAREMFKKFRQQQQEIDFTETNIRLFFQELQGRGDEILKSVVTDAFDKMTAWHAKNRVSEGWVTNTSWKVNHRLIVPWGVDSILSTYYLRRNDGFDDIDRALCVVSGKPYDAITTISNAVNEAHIPKTSGAELESTFFHIRLFLKGTVHLTWKDRNLLEEFNIRAAQARGWLPDDTNPSWAKVNHK